MKSFFKWRRQRQAGVRWYRLAALCPQEAQRKGTAQGNSKPPPQTIRRRRRETRCDRRVSGWKSAVEGCSACPWKKLPCGHHHQSSRQGCKHSTENLQVRASEIQKHTDPQRLVYDRTQSKQDICKQSLHSESRSSRTITARS